MFICHRIATSALCSPSNFCRLKLNRFCKTSSLFAQVTKAAKMSASYQYPVARKDESIEDVYHGKPVKDVYRWLEDPDAADTQAFVESQNKISQPFLEQGEEWKKLNEKLTKLWNYPKYGCPMKRGKYYYFYMNTGLQNQSVLYQQESLTAEPKVFFDPNLLSEDGTTSIAFENFSENGAYMAYGLSESGSDWTKIRIRKVESGEDFDETLEKVKFSNVSWTKDNKGFFYGCYKDQAGKTDGSETEQNQNKKVYYHRLGEAQSEDTLVAEFPEEPTWSAHPEVSDCGKYLMLPVMKGCKDNLLYYAELDSTKEIRTKLELVNIIDKFEADYEYVTNEGSRAYFRTNKNAPNYQLIIIDLKNPAQENWLSIVPEHEKDVLDWALCVNSDKLLLCYIRDVKSVLQVHDLTTGKLLRNFDLDIGTVTAVSGKKAQSEIFFTFGSFLNPGTTYHFDFNTPEVPLQVIRQIQLNLEGFQQSNYKVEQVFYASKDGTKVPMFIIRKNTEVMSPRPCLLYGYGGFNISLLPSFSITGLLFVDAFDGVLAYANLRGGGEYGEKWHNGGRLLNKQNVFDDFQAAAEFLIANNYTVKDRLAIQGGSNGGLLVAACINQRPDLFGAAVAHVGVMDMLRFHKFTIGYAWSSDYGSSDEKQHFENLIKYSPLHNVHTPKAPIEEYPSTLILTADHDDRVSPLHSLKFAAALQEAVRSSEYQKNPLLLRVYTKAGHGAGKPTSKRIDEATDVLMFIYKSLNIEKLNI